MKRTAFTLASLALVTFLAACNNDPGKDKAKAQVAEAVTTQTNSAPAPGATSETLKFSQDGSKVGWVGAKVTGKHDGGFGAFTGTITLVDKNPEKSQVSVEIDLASVTSDQERLTGHLKTADFLDTAKFPKAKFTSTGIKAGGENGASHTVTGNLQIRDVTKSISFPATIKASDTGVDVDAATMFRGLSFTADVGATQGFTLSGASPLTIGRGGLSNDTALRQTFSAPVVIRDTTAPAWSSRRTASGVTTKTWRSSRATAFAPGCLAMIDSSPPA